MVVVKDCQNSKASALSNGNWTMYGFIFYSHLPHRLLLAILFYYKKPTLKQHVTGTLLKEVFYKWINML